MEVLSHYRVLEKIAAGGMGEVFLAEDLNLGRKAAIKLLPEGFEKDPERVLRFEQEARTASSLNHPNILVIYEIGRENGRCFMATEFVRGKNLRHFVGKRKLTNDQIAEYATQITAGLSVAHDAGIVHRDLKPENIMVTDDGLIKILDFGLAKQTAIQPEVDARAIAKTATGIVVGTVPYMSPEQARGLPLDGRSDLFSLGTVLYELLSGHRPYDGATPSDTLVAILEKDPLPLNVPVPDWLAEILDRCLRKNPDERYQSA